MKNFTILFMIIPLCLFSQTQIGQDIDGVAANNSSGYSVSLSLDGLIVAIGAPYNADNGVNSGHVRVYQNISGTWTQIGNDINGEAAGDFSGASVSLSSDGSILAIGAPYNADNGVNSGHVRVYQNISGTWTQIGQDIDGEAAGDYCGWTVSLSSDGSKLAVGATFNSGVNGAASGHVRVFENLSSTWTQIGSDIDGEAVADRSGTGLSLSLDGSTVAIGSTYNAGNGANSGHVRVYKNISGVWTQVGSDIDGESAGDRSGIVSLSSDGSILAIGAASNAGINGVSSGHVRVFENLSSTWTQIGSDIDGEAAYDASGGYISLSSDGSIVAIGAIYNTGVTGTNSGHVRIYKNISGVWTQIGSDIDGEAANNFSGAGLSLSSDGSTVAIGAIYNAGNGVDSGHVRVYDLSAILSAESFNIELSRVYPNPATTEIHITLKNNLQLLKVNLYNELGQFIKESKTNTINVSDVSKGMYLVEIETDQGKGIKKVLLE